MRGRGSTSGGPPKGQSNILLEIASVGSSLKVTAVDEASGLEVSFVAPANTARADIERLARAKLSYVAKKKGAP
ncbi:MAG: serine hydroxymethyltransferase [Alphaproteobacteria bacterium]|nr:serine hydroxymethyltransferase [Alphaproteobacteria bacterium]